MSDFAEIWSTLSQVDLSQHIKKIKAGSRQLSYLSWSDAWEVLMTYYPNSTFEVLPSEVFEDTTVEVWVSVTINDHTRIMWLPVMDHRNNSIPSPSSRQVSDARMRCLVKCLGIFGLGLYIYQGEDLPRKEETSEKDVFMHLIATCDAPGMALFVREVSESDLSKIYNSFPDKHKSSTKEKCMSLVSEGNELARTYAEGIKESFTNGDLTGLIEYKSEMDSKIKKLVAPLLTEDEIKALKEVKVQ